MSGGGLPAPSPGKPEGTPVPLLLPAARPIRTGANDHSHFPAS